EIFHAGLRVTSTPSNTTVPERAFTEPAMAFSADDFPAPLAPRSTEISPGCTVTSSLRRPTRFPYATRRSVTARISRVLSAKVCLPHLLVTGRLDRVAARNDLAEVHPDDGVADAGDQTKVVFDQDLREALAPKISQEFRDVFALARIHPGDRLVE